MNRLTYHHEIFMGAKHGQVLGRVRKWLHSGALRHAGGDFNVSDVLVLFFVVCMIKPTDEPL